MIIIHDSDEDGFLAATIFKGFVTSNGVLSDDVELIATRDRKELPVYDYTDERVVILDLTYTPEQITELAGIAKNVCIIDHHKSELDGLVSGYISPDHCTAWLTWEYCYPCTNIPWIVEVVDAYDRHTGYGEFEKTIVLGLRRINLISVYSIWENLLDAAKPDFDKDVEAFYLDEILRIGEIELDRHNKTIVDVIAKEKYRVIDYNGYTAAVLSATTNTALLNDLSNAICTEADVDLVINHYFVSKTNELQVSFRSLKTSGVDVEVMAKALGEGGGHKSAAGVRLSFDDGMIFLNSIR